MHTIQVYNVNDALCFGISAILKLGMPNESRNGKVLMCPTPVTTAYLAPCERVLFSPERDANPFFHLFESMWMLAGRNDVEFPSHYSKQLASYSVDGETLHGAYGHRWRKHFGFDQVELAIEDLRKDPNSRRVIISMWDATVDTRSTEDNAKDRPCNDLVKFQAIPLQKAEGEEQRYALNMSVFCRSNDAVWGAYGANAVHFSYLHEYVAHATGMMVGRYSQISDNLHIYDDALYGPIFGRILDTNQIGERTGFPTALSPELEKGIVFTHRDEKGEKTGEFMISQYNLYTRRKVTFLAYPFTLVDRATDPNRADQNRATFDHELQILLDDRKAEGLTHPFLSLVIQPLMTVYEMYREGKGLAALATLRQAENYLNNHQSELCKRVNEEGIRVDWFQACEEWLLRRPSVQVQIASVESTLKAANETSGAVQPSDPQESQEKTGEDNE